MIRDNDLISTNIEEMARALESAGAELIEQFLYSLLTPSETDEIAKRWALVKEIAAGTPQREIAKSLGLSLCKITRGSRELKKEGSSFKRMLALAGIKLQEIKVERVEARQPAFREIGSFAAQHAAERSMPAKRGA
jgi:TrpR family transcriptional regulator, trp operon repressor